MIYLLLVITTTAGDTAYTAMGEVGLLQCQSYARQILLKEADVSSARCIQAVETKIKIGSGK